ncbi:hypothetical protein BDF21DRAFT_350039 [Thamnidium elegans]|nr:hypothetical protein BDF21DRAFT_350039 [Thamnidium elegans]
MIQKLNRIFDGIFEYYTVSIPFNTVARPKFKTRFLTKVQEILPFIREIIVKTQLFVNYYIMVNCHQTIPNDIFTPKFWYRLCLVIGCRLAPTASQERYRSVPSLVDTYNDFLSLFPTSIKPIGTVRDYSQCLSAACITISSTYNNYYVETYKGKLQKYLIYKLSVEFSEIASYIIKKIVNDYAFNYQHRRTPRRCFCYY